MKLVLSPQSNHRSRKLIALSLVGTVLSLAVAACSSTPSDGADDTGGAAGSGGTSQTTGGSSGDGGSVASGGSIGGQGGQGGLGGETNTGGTASGGAATGGSGTGGADSIPTLTVSDVDDIPDKSAPDYGDNEHGVISGGTFSDWVTDWEGSRPEGITGNLVVLQIVPSNVTSAQVLTAKPSKGVYSYLVNATVFNQARENGLSDFETDLPDGPSFDAFLKKYAIDPRKDLIVLDFEQQPSTTNAVVQSIGRGWLFFRYWGVAKEHLAILNGSLNFNATNYGLPIDGVGKHKYSDPTNDGKVTARHLGTDNTVLWLTADEIKNYLDQGEGAPVTADVRILDARGGAEALGLPWATSTGRTTCAGYADKPGGGASGTAVNKCSTPIEGRIRSAKSVPWTGLLDTSANGFRFLPPSVLADLFKTQGGWDTATSKQAWVYCRTNQRSTVNGIVANVILGYPTRFYETSFIEWGHLTGGPAKDYGPTEATQHFSVNPYNAATVVANKSVIADGDVAAPYRVDNGRTDNTADPENYSYSFAASSYTEHAVLDAADVALYVAGGTLGTLTKPVTWVPGPLYNAERYVAPKVAGTYPTSGWPLVNTAATSSAGAIEADKAYLAGE